MTPTHAISADEARRLLNEDRENQRHQSAIRSARSWVAAHGMEVNEHNRIVTPFGTFSPEELWGKP